MEKIRNTVIETLKQNPQGLSPKEIYEKLNNEFDKKDLQEVLSLLWKENNSLIGSDRKLRMK